MGVLILIMASIIFFYTQKDKSQIEGQITNIEEIQAKSEELPLASEPTLEIKEFQITARQFEFIPETIVVNQGDRIKLAITTLDVVHGFLITEYNIDERIEPGEIKIIEFIADKKGEFPIVCNVPCGSGHGNMRGKLVVN